MRQFNHYNKEGHEISEKEHDNLIKDDKYRNVLSFKTNGLECNVVFVGVTIDAVYKCYVVWCDNGMFLDFDYCRDIPEALLILSEFITKWGSK